MIGRRSFITGLVSLVAAPAIVRAGLIMPVRVMVEPVWIGMDFGRSPALVALGLLSQEFPDEWKVHFDTQKWLER